MRVISNNKELVRFRRERNLVAKNNKHRGGFHTERKRPNLVRLHGGMSIQEINDWWESSI